MTTNKSGLKLKISAEDMGDLNECIQDLSDLVGSIESLGAVLNDCEREDVSGIGTLLCALTRTCGFSQVDFIKFFISEYVEAGEESE